MARIKRAVVRKIENNLNICIRHDTGDTMKKRTTFLIASFIGGALFIVGTFSVLLIYLAELESKTEILGGILGIFLMIISVLILYTTIREIG